MSTQMQLTYQHRENKRTQIERFFLENVGQKFSSRDMHWRYGSSFRTRVSEINRDDASKVSIKNEVMFKDGNEQSCYWGEAR